MSAAMVWGRHEGVETPRVLVLVLPAGTGHRRASARGDFTVVGAYPAEDCVSMSFLFRNGMHGCGMWNFGSHERFDEVQIVGSEGRISFSTFGAGEIVVARPGEPDQRYAVSNPVHIQQPMIARVVQSLIGGHAAGSGAHDHGQLPLVVDSV